VPGSDAAGASPCSLPPRLIPATSDGEYVATTGLLPKSGVWSMYQSGDNAMPFAMGNQLRRLGYTTRAWHNHVAGRQSV